VGGYVNNKLYGGSHIPTNGTHFVRCFNPPYPPFFYDFFLAIKYIPYLCMMDNESKILKLPGLEYFGSWETMQKFLEKRGNPLYSIDGDLDLYGTKIKSLGNLESVGSFLDLGGTKIESLGNLKKVGGYLNFKNTPLSQMYSEKEIRRMIHVRGNNRLFV
jgi:hypothetical protein